jgi:hypothetical protein
VKSAARASTPAALPVVAASGLALLGAATLVVPKGVALLAALAAVTAVVAAAHRRLFAWDTLLATLIATIFFIPIKRYTMSGGGGFNLEPYRILVALVAAAWGASLLADSRVRARRSGMEKPILLFVAAIFASIAANDGRIREFGIQTEVIKTLTFFGSFFAIFYLVVSLVRTHKQMHRLMRVLVASGSVVAVSALVESRLHFNVFNHLHILLPGTQFHDPALTAGLTAAYLDRSGVLRVYASSAHPIELSAVLVMLVPLAVYLLKTTGRRRWLAAAVVLVVGNFATLSRTGVIMLVVEGLVFLWLRPVETRRIWPMLVPAFLVVAIALPHQIGSFYAAFFPKGGIVAEQAAHDSTNPNDSGRLARIGPSLRAFAHQPLVGDGFGTRITQISGVQNAVKATGRILDDQWLGTLLDTGSVGTLGLLWWFARTIRRLGRLAKRDAGAVGWLGAALAASLYAFAVGMLTFDAFGFIQVTILTFVLLALSASLLAATTPQRRELLEHVAGE